MDRQRSVNAKAHASVALDDPDSGPTTILMDLLMRTGQTRDAMMRMTRRDDSGSVEYTPDVVC